MTSQAAGRTKPGPQGPSPVQPPHSAQRRETRPTVQSTPYTVAHSWLHLDRASGWWCRDAAVEMQPYLEARRW